MSAAKVLLFDLGGVLVETVGLRELPRLMAEPMAAAELRRKWLASPAVACFESGLCSSETFASAFIAEWGLGLAPKEFLAHFRSWVVAPYPGTAQLLVELRTRYMLACLSNTNAVHWEELLHMDGLRPALERPFTSYRLGAMKPSATVYAHVVRELGCKPGEIAFFDDGPENVEAAAAAGISAHLTVGPDQLRNVLGELGLL